MRAKLVTVDPFEPALTINLDHWPIVIGSAEKCDVLLDNRWVSDQHCEISLQEGKLFVRDLSSQTGTFVNGEPIQQAELLPQDTLTIGIRCFLASYRPPSRKNGAVTLPGLKRDVPASDLVQVKEGEGN